MYTCVCEYVCVYVCAYICVLCVCVHCTVCVLVSAGKEAVALYLDLIKQALAPCGGKLAVFAGDALGDNSWI